MAPTSTRTTYTDEFKIKVAKRGKEIGYRPAGKEYNVNEKNVRRWAKALNSISDAPINRPIARTPRHRPMFPDIEAQVSNFIDENRNNDDGFTFSRTIICNEARRIAREMFGLSVFTASHGWYQRFMHRMGYTIQELNRREPLGNQPRSPAENSDPAGFDHGQVEGTPSPDDPENFQVEAMKTGEILDMIDQITAAISPVATDHGPDNMVSESVACNIPTTADDPEAIPFQEIQYSWLSSEVHSSEFSDLLSVTMDYEQLEYHDLSFDLTQYDEVSPWLPAYRALQEKNDQSYQMLHPIVSWSLG